jgi:hypothetical protein
MSSEGSNDRLFKVIFDLPGESEDWPPYATEALWISKTPVKFEARLENSPYFARGVSYLDIVRVRPDNERRSLVFDRLVRQSGHSTVRLMVENGDIERVRDMLREAGCTWESSERLTFLAVDVPPEVNYLGVRRALLGLRAEGAVGIDEGAISEIHQAQLADGER